MPPCSANCPADIRASWVQGSLARREMLVVGELFSPVTKDLQSSQPELNCSIPYPGAWSPLVSPPAAFQPKGPPDATSLTRCRACPRRCCQPPLPTPHTTVRQKKTKTSQLRRGPGCPACFQQPKTVNACERVYEHGSHIVTFAHAVFPAVICLSLPEQDLLSCYLGPEQILLS